MRALYGEIRFEEVHCEWEKLGHCEFSGIYISLCVVEFKGVCKRNRYLNEMYLKGLSEPSKEI